MILYIYIKNFVFEISKLGLGLGYYIQNSIALA